MTQVVFTVDCGGVDMWRKYWFKRLAKVTSEEEEFKGRKMDL